MNRIKSIAAVIIMAAILTSAVSGQTADSEEKDGPGITGGGRIWAAGGILWEWDNWAKPENPTDAFQYVDLDSSFWIQAVPSDILSAYGKASFNFEGRNNTGTDEARDFTEVLSESFSIDALYAEITALPYLILAGGKRDLDWGLGRYFSPADYINSTPVDYRDPDAEATGIFAISAEVPVAEQRFIVHLLLTDSERPWEIEIAPQAVLSFGPVEARIGGKYQYNGPIFTSLGAAANILIFSPFVEASMEYFSDRAYVSQSEEDIWPDGLEVRQARETFIFETTAGTGITLAELGIDAYLQYLYNSWGSLYGEDLGILRNSGVDILLDEGRISESDLFLPGSHYLALAVDWNIFKTGLHFDADWLINLQELSYGLDLCLAFRPLPYIDISLHVPIALHDYLLEFNDFSNGWRADVSVGMGAEF